MGPAAAIKTGFAKSFQFKGRASRSEFWWFAPASVAAAVVLAWLILPMVLEISWYMKFIVAFLSLTPFWASGARRLQDTGEDGRDIFIPAALLFGVPVSFAVLLFVASATHGLIGILLLIFLGIPTICLTFFLTFAALGPVIGQLIVPSQIDANRFGPNPNEVLT